MPDVSYPNLFVPGVFKRDRVTYLGLELGLVLGLGVSVRVRG